MCIIKKGFFKFFGVISHQCSLGAAQAEESHPSCSALVPYSGISLGKSDTSLRLSSVYDRQTLDPSSWEQGLTVVMDSIMESL